MCKTVKIDELRASLYELFSAHGEVTQIVASKANKRDPKRKDGVPRRGYAFIVFHDIAHASAAKKALGNFPFYHVTGCQLFAQESV